MSIETDFRAMLAAHVPLTALVGSRIVQHAVEDNEALPYVVFTATHDHQGGLNGEVQIELVTFSVECWATKALDADAVATQVRAAIDAYDAAQTSVSVAVTGDQAGYDGELELDGRVLTVEWWRL